MSKGKELKITVGFQPHYERQKEAPIAGTALRFGTDLLIRGFTCTVEGPSLAGKYGFYLVPEERKIRVLPLTNIGNSPIEPITVEGKGYFAYVQDFAPLALALQSYALTEDESAKIDGFFPYPPGLVPEKLDPEALDYFGDLLIRILKGAGYRPRLQKIFLLPKTWKDTTALLRPQRFFSADKTGNILAELLSKAKEKDIPFEWDAKGENAIGLKVTFNIPGKRAIEEDAQLTFTHAFEGEDADGFKVIPINDLDKPEVQDGIRRIVNKIEKAVCKEMDPLALRVKDGLLCLAQDKGWQFSFFFDENELLDLLFERDRKGYHSKGNRGNVAKRLILLHQSTWNYAIKIGGNKLEIRDAPYIILNPDGKAFVEVVEKKGKRKVRYDFQSVQISKAYQSLFSGGKYLSQHDREALKLQQAAYSLYKYISQRWRIGWQEDQGVYEWTHSEVLEEAGVAVPKGKNKWRDSQRIEGYYKDMKEKGFIKDYGRRFQHKDPFRDKWFWEAPDEFKEVYRQMGLEYERKREIRELKDEKKKLKLAGEVIDLQTKAK